MFDIGFQEVTIIAIVALIVVGPERLPALARNVGLWVGRIRRYVAHVKTDIEREVNAQEMRDLLRNPTESLGDVYEAVEDTRSTLKESAVDFEQAGRAISESTGSSGDAKPSSGGNDAGGVSASTESEQKTGGSEAAVPLTPPDTAEPAVSDGERSKQP